MENEQHEVASNEQAHESKDVEVSLSQQELTTLDELGPDNEAVKRWLVDNNIGEHDRIIAHVDGRNDVMVLDAGAADFLTNDTAASQELNEAMAANAARTIVDLETEIDTRSTEISAETSPESEPRITEEEIRDIGEEGLDSVGVDDPSENDTEANSTNAERNTAAMIESIEHTYNQQVLAIREALATDIARPLSILDSSSEAVRLGERTVLENTSYTLQDLEATLRNYENYPLSAVQTRLRASIDGLHHAAGAIGLYGEQTLSEAEHALSAVDKKLSEQSEQATRRDDDVKTVLTEQGVGEASFDAEAASGVVAKTKETIGDLATVRADLTALDADVNGFKSEVVKTIDSLQVILTESYNRPIDPDAINQLVRRLKQSASLDGDLAKRMRTAGGNLQVTLSNIHRAYEDLTR